MLSVCLSFVAVSVNWLIVGFSPPEILSDTLTRRLGLGAGTEPNGADVIQPAGFGR
jgi:hypothetical protein